MTSLNLLQDYSSSSDDEENVTAAKKMRLPQPDLPNFGVPRSISREPVAAVKSDRVRSFAHEAGNWATYVAIPVDPPPEMDSFIDNITAAFSSLSLKEVEDWHVSLTKVLVLRHHWIDGFVRTMGQVLESHKTFNITLQGLSIYTNEDKTRTFVAVEVKYGRKILDELVTSFDKCLVEYGLPKFYETRSFHMSVLWGLGDLFKEAEEILKNLTDASITNYVIPLKVTSCVCKTGNKIFNLPLLS